MRLVLCLLLLLFIAPAYSQEQMNGKGFFENLKSKCRLGFDEEVVGRIKNSGFVASKIDGRDFISTEFTLKIRETEKTVEVRVNIYCMAKEDSQEIPEISMTPREQIEQEDSGGRYYRHVAWQKRISGINWKGKAAHVNALHGDGEVLPVNFYLVCLKVNGNPCLQINVQPPRTAIRKVHSTVMKMISRIEYFE